MSNAMTRNQKPQTPKSLLAILIRLSENGAGSTAADLDTDAIRMGRLQKLDLVKVTGKVESGRRGRPAHRYSLTDKGRGRAKRAAQKVAA
jgi:predicted ArsR family transcriptional regulator